MEMVLVRKPGLLSSFDDGFFACSVVVWEGVHGEPPLLTCGFGRAARFMRAHAKLFRFNVFTPRALCGAFSFTIVNAR